MPHRGRTLGGSAGCRPSHAAPPPAPAVRLCADLVLAVGAGRGAEARVLTKSLTNVAAFGGIILTDRGGQPCPGWPPSFVLFPTPGLITV